MLTGGIAITSIPRAQENGMLRRQEKERPMAHVLRTAGAEEVAALLSLKESTVCWLASQGKLPGSKVGKFWRFDLEKIERFFAQDRNGKDHPPEYDANEEEM